MDDINIKSDELKSDIREGNVDLAQKYDEYVTYNDIIKKDILDLMGFSAEYPEEKRKVMNEKIGEALESRIAGIVLGRLSEMDRLEYDKLLLESKNKEAYEFLEARRINVEEIVVWETLIFKLELYEDSKVLRDEASKVVEKHQGEKDA